MDQTTMDVLLDDEERQVIDQSRAFLSAACPPSLVRAAEVNGKYSSELWKQVVAMGWLDICMPEEAGGLGLPLHYATLLFEEAGRHLAPVPLLSVMVPAIVLTKNDWPQRVAVLDQVRNGDKLLSFAIQEENGVWSAEAIHMLGSVDGDTVVLNGVKMFVDNFAISDYCLVAFRMGGGAGGLTLALVETKTAGISHAELVPTAKDSQALVRFNNVRVPVSDIVGVIGKADRMVAELMEFAALFATALMVGAARKATELAVAYANERWAFEQPLGSFQAVQHACADMTIGVDGAELLCREASWKLGQGMDASVEISQAKAFANDKSVMACRSAQQIHGGIGFIMEFDLQLWYRRVVSWSTRYGTTAEHRSRVADSLFQRKGKIRLDRGAPN
jgi:alkylation response protein AidB-like acyl-CoA dehydrogenase